MKKNIIWQKNPWVKNNILHECFPYNHLNLICNLAQDHESAFFVQPMKMRKDYLFASLMVKNNNKECTPYPVIDIYILAILS